MKRILVPLDGSEYSDRALEKAKVLAAAMGSKVVLLNVLSIVTIMDYEANLRFAQANALIDWTHLLDEAHAKSQALLDEANAKLPGISTEEVMIDEPGGRFAHAIAEYAENNDIDMIIMGSNGVGSLRQRLYLGSVTTKVLQLTKVPVLVVQ